MNTTPICAVTTCAIPNQHHPDCTTNDCTGCLPALAADGILICNHHYRNAVRALRELPALDDDLCKAVVRRTGAITEYVKVIAPSTGINLDQAVLDTKDSLREDLSAFVAHVIEERGVQPLTSQDVRTMARFLERHAMWIAANKYVAAAFAIKIPSAAADAKRHAYPSRPDGVSLGQCTCGTTVRYTPSHYSGDNTATCRGCGTTLTVAQWEQHLNAEPADTDRYTTTELVRCIAVRLGTVIPESTIRRWASTGKLTQHGKDHRGRGLYDPTEAIQLANTLRADTNPNRAVS